VEKMDESNIRFKYTIRKFDENGIKDISNIIMVSGFVASKAEEKGELGEEFPQTGVFSLEELVLAVKQMLGKETVRSVPGLNCRHYGYDACLGLAMAILRGEAVLEDCEVLSTNLATLKVDGRVIPMGGFPKRGYTGSLELSEGCW
jgi:hypothetical protein